MDKYKVDDENINDEFERIVNLKMKERESKKGLKGKYKQDGDDKDNQSKKRAKSEIPRFRNKSKSEANSFQLISPQTNLLNAWNILKP